MTAFVRHPRTRPLRRSNSPLDPSLVVTPRNAGTLRLNANADSLVSFLLVFHVGDVPELCDRFSRLQLPECDGHPSFVQRLRDLDLRHPSRCPSYRPHVPRRARQLRAHLVRYLRS